MTAPTVLADAIVRSRDGRSILDRDEHGTEPAKAFAADPDRLRAAVRALEDAGLTVDGINPVTITFHGPPDAFVTAFAVRPVDGSVRGAAVPGWTVAGAASFDVAAEGSLGGTLHRVLLLPPSVARATRLAGMQEVTFGRGPAVPEVADLVLGELGPTVGETFPHRMVRTSFPGRDAASTLTVTRDALREWLADPLRLGVRTHIAQRRRSGARGMRVRAVISETRVAATLGDVWSRVREGLPPLPDRTWTPRVRAAGSPPDFATALIPEYVRAQAYTWLATTCTDIDHHVGRFRLLVEHWADQPYDDRDDLLAGQWATVGRRAGELRDWIAEQEATGSLLRELPAVDPDTWSQAALDGVGAALVPDVGVAAEHLNVGIELAATVRSWSAWAADRGQALRAEIVDNETQHASMVVQAFLAVAGELVDLDVIVGRGSGLAADPLRFAPGIHTVYSVSEGCYGRPTADLIDATRRCREVWSAPGSRRVLDVQATGNDQRAFDEPDLPDLTGSLLANVDNAVVVGGCTPRNGRWVVSASTHGYVVGGTGGADVPVPHVCATTKGDSGGGLVFPHLPTGSAPGAELRWYLGDGSSLSTPIVAAVAAVVWSVFPDLTSQQVKRAVLAGARPLAAGGEFHLPTLEHAELRPGSHAWAGHPGRARAVLRPALHEARENSEVDLFGELAALLPVRPRPAPASGVP